MLENEDRVNFSPLRPSLGASGPKRDPRGQKIYSIFVLIIFLILLFFIPKKINPTDVAIVSLAGQNIKVELALTAMQKEQGLSARQGLAEGEGMLFVFDSLGKYSFWMKDMNFPLDIIWLAPSKSGDDENIEVVYIKENALPSSFPLMYGADIDAQYVLEVNAGFTQKNNLKIGDKVVFTY